MDTTILTAVIAASAAFIGALIPSIFSYLGKQKEYKNDQNAKLEEIRRKEYSNYIQALQIMVNEGNKENFLQLQASTNNVMLFAGPKLSDLVSRYFNDVVQRALQQKSLTLEEQNTYLSNIFNAIREELGISKEKLKKVSMVNVSM